MLLQDLVRAREWSLAQPAPLCAAAHLGSWAAAEAPFLTTPVQPTRELRNHAGVEPQNGRELLISGLGVVGEHAQTNAQRPWRTVL